MKLSLALLALVSGASAFAPHANVASRASMLSMSEEAAAVEAEVEAEPEPEPVVEAAPVAAAKVAPAIVGAIPTTKKGESLFLGENWWNKITTEWGSAETGTFVRAAELKHGRSAMIATVGYAFQKLGITFDNISVHEYLSVTENVKFADLAAMTPAEAIKAVPDAGLAQMFCAIALVEFYELTHANGKVAYDETVAPGLQPGGLTGDLGWNPLGIEVTERRQLVELQNGRAAMIAIFAWVSADAIPGSVPLPLPW